MMNIRTKVYGNQKCKNPFMETKKDKRERIEETAKATVHAIKMAIQYSLVDRIRCFRGFIYGVKSLARY